MKPLSSFKPQAVFSDIDGTLLTSEHVVSPFTDRGSISEIFTDMGVWLGIKKVIDTINANAAA